VDKLLIEGGVPLAGEVSISGAKNAALPLICAALLTDKPLTLANVPHLNDVTTMLRLLAQMGVDVTLDEKNSLVLDAGGLNKPEAPYDMVKTMRASILTLGPLLARTGRARVSLPGGCAIGARPVDIHIRGLQAMGAEIRVEQGYILAQAKRLRGARIFCDQVTVTGTENLMMAAALADGVTVIENAAREPEVVDLADCLNAMGAKVSGAGGDIVTVEGVERLGGAAHRIMPDRIETGTFLVAVALTGGRVRLNGTRCGILDAVVEKLREAGAMIDCHGTPSRFRPRAAQCGEPAHGALSGLPDRHAGSVHGHELRGARRGGGYRNHLREPLHACPGTAPARRRHRDQRQHRGGEGRAAAGRRHRHGHRPARLGLPGRRRPGGPRRTLIDRIYHLDRGYEHIEEKLMQLGARIRRVH
jgi:UDP-N-acetylglucosamine 1-carboxyvinyltransferase